MKKRVFLLFNSRLRPRVRREGFPIQGGSDAGAKRFLLALALSVLSLSFSVAQCPANEADLANGGTFSSAGTCNVNVGGAIIITGDVIWNGPGTLAINGDAGDIDIANGGSLTINGGTARTTNNGDGDLDVLNGGSLVVANGATFTAYEEIQVQNGGSITISGTVNSQESNIDIDNGGIVTVNPTGSLRAGSNGDTNADILVQGTLINNGLIDADDDITLSGTATFTNNGTAHADSDIELNGTVTNSGDIDAGNNIEIDGVVTNSGGIDAGNDIDIDGTMISSGTIDGDNIDIDGSLTNSGSIDSDEQITVTGTLISSGDITTDSDFVVDGGDVTIQNGGTLYSDEDLKVYDDDDDDGGSLTIDQGGSVTVDNDIINNTDADGGGDRSQGSFIINGTLTGNDDFTIQNTNPNSSVTGTGTINIAGTYNDAECPTVGDFCICEGTAVGPCNSSVLPVELISFSAKLNNNAVELRWSTAVEINNDFFTIQKTTDFETFHEVGLVKGQGDSKEVHSYSFVDESPFLGKSYYRIKQTDFDGQFSPSDPIMINYEGPASPVLSAYPNPFNGSQLHIKLSGLKDHPAVPVCIYNQQGQKVYESVLTEDGPGFIQKELQFSTPLQQGIYIIKAGKTLQLTHKIVVN
jgi:hypothetical protein